MLLPDVNVLVYAVRPDSEEHERYRAWLDSMVNGDSAFGCSDHVLGGFLRVVTHPRVFARPDRLGDALPSLTPCGRGNLVPDAYLAALAIESGCTRVTTDRDYARFEGLRWRHPLLD